MFLVLSKTLDKLVSPFFWIVVIGLVGVFVGKRRPRLGRTMSLASVVLLLLGSWGPVVDTLFNVLESSARTTMRPDITYDAVVVLGGMTEIVREKPDDMNTGISFSSSVDRVLAAFALFHAGKAKTIVLSGGDVTLVGEQPAFTEAYGVARELRRWGVPDEQIVVEGKSQNTHENAVESARIIREHGWQNVLLITSAFHMKRAAGCFEAAGVKFDTLPTDFRQTFYSPFEDGVIPSANYLGMTEMGVHELAGRVVYRLKGYSTDW